MPHLYFNEESDYSEENTCDNEESDYSEENKSENEVFHSNNLHHRKKLNKFMPQLLIYYIQY